MSSSFWLMRVESHDFSQAEKERTFCKTEQIHKMCDNYFHSKWSLVVFLSENGCYFVNLLSFAKTRGHVARSLH